VDGKLTSLNPNEPLKQHVYVYNQIFFSFAVDTPLSYQDLTNSDSSPSFTQSNHDITGLHQLQDADISNLYHLATCLVNYRGHRLICQSIIPGILNNSDLASLAEYGTVDDKKNIVANEQFHELMSRVAEALNIKVNKLIDPSDGKTVEIAGSIEVKGIRGSDKRPYVVDL
jgi:protein TIF31